MNTLAKRLIWARTQKEISQQELADKAGVAQSTIGSLESGARRSARKIVVIANVLGVDALWLAEGKGKPKDDIAFPDDGESASPINAALLQRPTRWSGLPDGPALASSLHDLSKRASPRSQAALVKLIALANQDALKDDDWEMIECIAEKISCAKT